jgi:hypothetical protein
MQDLFQDYAEVLVGDTAHSMNAIKKVNLKKLKKQLDSVDKKKEIKALIMGELDSDALYDMLEAADK